MSNDTGLWVSLVVSAFGAGISVGAVIASWDIRRERRKAQSVPDGNENHPVAPGNPKSASVSAPPLAEASATLPNDPHYGAWREADDLILFKLPGHEPFRISNKAAERLYYDFAKICGKPEAVAEPVESQGQKTKMLVKQGQNHE